MRASYVDEPLRVALLAYRGNPHCGGQGVYVRYLARELVALGHHVEVFSGPPYPELEDGATLRKVPSLDLYRQPDPFRIPHLSELQSLTDLLELSIMATAGFPEPLTFSVRVRRQLAGRRHDFDVVHDNQCLGWGILALQADGWPVLGTMHHPITVDRRLDLERARGAVRRLTLRRWYGFVRMQAEVARQLPRVVTVSESSRRDLAEEMGIDPGRVAVVPVGVDTVRFRPLPGTTPVPGRIMTTASADVPMKGLVPLLEAVAKVRTERACHLVVVGTPRPDSQVGETIDRLGLAGSVRFESGVSDEGMVELYRQAQVAVVPSLYEGFSLPAVEAMACGVPLVATTGGALPEVVGESGRCGLLVPPDDSGALAHAMGRVLDDPALGARLGAAGRARALERFSWRVTALSTAAEYRELLALRAPGSGSLDGPATSMPRSRSWTGLALRSRLGASRSRLAPARPRKGPARLAPEAGPPGAEAGPPPVRSG
jgi:glycosyltransferase involved in cell wall biosynthesis